MTHQTHLLALVLIEVVALVIEHGHNLQHRAASHFLFGELVFGFDLVYFLLHKVVDLAIRLKGYKGWIGIYIEVWVWAWAWAWAWAWGMGLGFRARATAWALGVDMGVGA